MKRSFIVAIIALASVFAAYKIANAEMISNLGSECADVLIVFSRGSSSNPNHEFLEDPFGKFFSEKEEVPGAFFQSMKKELDDKYPHVTYKAVSVHNFPNLYNDNGYRAVGIFGSSTINNGIQGELTWWPWGEYNDSVSDGTNEVSGYIKDQVSLCPNQKVVLGGYSQGAHVAGQALFDLSDTDKEKLEGVALFGDPKYIGSQMSSLSVKLNWYDGVLKNTIFKPKSEPWKRGTAALADTGILDARIPYVPSDMKEKTLSWCFQDDFICTGQSGIFQSIGRSLLNLTLPITQDDLGQGHTRYSTFGVSQAATEIVQKMSFHLATLEAQRGGFNNTQGPQQTNPVKAGSNPIELMLMINKSSGMDDVISNMRLYSKEVLQLISVPNSRVAFGLGDYNENGILPDKRIPNLAIHLNPTKDINNFESKTVRQLAFGRLSGGGLDPGDPHQLAVERGVMSTNWSQNATKHLVLITDRPFLDNYTYNICNSDVRTGFGIITPNKCMTDPAQETDLSRLHPERCENVYLVLTEDECKLNMLFPYHTHNISRSLIDALNIAVSKGVAVSVVVPHDIPSTYPSNTIEQLKKFALDSGGLYLKYATFNKSSYADALWRIANHQPKQLPLAMISNFDRAEAVKSEAYKVANGEQWKPVLLDASSSSTYDKYSWDFDGDGVTDNTTSAPTDEFIYDKPLDQAFASVTAYQENTAVARGVVPLNIISSSLIQSGELPLPPKITKAERDGDILTLQWETTEASEGEMLVVGNIELRTPIVSIGMKSGILTVNNAGELGNTVLVWAENEYGKSDEQNIQITTKGKQGEDQEDESSENREPSDKVISESESVTDWSALKGILEQNNQQPQQLLLVEDSNYTSTSSYNPQSAASTNSIQSSSGSVTEVAGATNFQQTANISATQLANEFLPKPETSQNSSIFLPIAIGAVVVIVIAGAGLAFLKFSSSTTE